MNAGVCDGLGGDCCERMDATTKRPPAVFAHRCSRGLAAQLGATMYDRSVPVQPSSNRETARLSRVDGCPECLNYESPIEARSAEGGGFCAGYWCQDCGHIWVTCWADE